MDVSSDMNMTAEQAETVIENMRARETLGKYEARDAEELIAYLNKRYKEFG